MGASVRAVAEMWDFSSEDFPSKEGASESGVRRPHVMGVLNVTPDSFSDGGLHDDPQAHGLSMLEGGADIIDVGGESTRPGAGIVDPGEERRRILPVIAALARQGACVSVDTRHAATMQAALDAGASIVNDVSALTHDMRSAPLLAARTCRIVLMHMRGTPQTMQAHATYIDIVAEVAEELGRRVAAAEAAGIDRGRIAIDPGFGFAKTPAQNLALLRGLGGLSVLGLPILAGVSRKGFVSVYGGESDPRRRGPASIAAGLFAVSQGARILRVHDVAETIQALRMWQAVSACGKGGAP